MYFVGTLNKEIYRCVTDDIVETPDFIIEANKPDTAVILKEIVDNGEKFQTVL